ncbi:MAG: glycosyltransferase family 2 protein [Candidatus Thiodiazotropha sp.]
MTNQVRIGENGSMSVDNTNNVVAVTVTYNVDDRFESALLSYLDQVAKVIVVDNSSDPESREWLAAWVNSMGDRVRLIQNGQNLGLGRAQNIGIRAALDGGAEWLLLMDDDSRAAPDMVSTLLQTAQQQQANLAILAPCYHEQSVSREARYVTAPEGAYNKPRFLIQDFSMGPIVSNLFIAISSGSLIRASLFRDIGLIRESFSIDYLDVDFCLRALRRGYRILAVGDAVLYHQLGAQTEHRLLGWRFWAWNHSVSRRYTIYRNRTRIWREYLFTFPGFIFYDMLASLHDLLRILMFEQSKLRKLWAAVKGMAVGLLGGGLSGYPVYKSGIQELNPQINANNHK